MHILHRIHPHSGKITNGRNSVIFEDLVLWSTKRSYCRSFDVLPLHSEILNQNSAGPNYITASRPIDEVIPITVTTLKLAKAIRARLVEVVIFTNLPVKPMNASSSQTAPALEHRTFPRAASLGRCATWYHYTSRQELIQIQLLKVLPSEHPSRRAGSQHRTLPATSTRGVG